MVIVVMVNVGFRPSLSSRISHRRLRAPAAGYASYAHCWLPADLGQGWGRLWVGLYAGDQRNLDLRRSPMAFRVNFHRSMLSNGHRAESAQSVFFSLLFFLPPLSEGVSCHSFCRFLFDDVGAGNPEGSS